jgi:hypothetical protein
MGDRADFNHWFGRELLIVALGSELNVDPVDNFRASSPIGCLYLIPIGLMLDQIDCYPTSR